MSAVTEVPQEKVNWGYNCLTAGVHHGRQTDTWREPLKGLLDNLTVGEIMQTVSQRIKDDAQQYADVGMLECGVDAVMIEFNKIDFGEWYLLHLVALEGHYKQLGMPLGERYMEDRPTLYMHQLDQDSLNMVCRILGQRACIRAHSKQ